MIYVCSKTKVAETISAVGASRLVTLLTHRADFQRPDSIVPANHLFLEMNDVLAEQPGMIVPARRHVEELISFVEEWDRTSPLVINCFAGISRSTAAAYISVAALSPIRCEEELAQTLRRSSPSATPNLRLIRHADEILGRNGRMVAAIEAIGRGADAFEGTPFSIAVGERGNVNL